jgi:subtilisin family serine protease
MAWIGILAILMSGIGYASASARTETDKRFKRLSLPAGTQLDDKLSIYRQLDKPLQVVVELRTPPVGAAQGARLDAGQPALSAAEQRGIAAQIAGEQNAVATQIRTLGGTVHKSYRLAYNGLRVTTTLRQALAMSKLPGVVAVRRLIPVHRSNTASVPFIGAPEAWESLGLTGKNVRVGIIDTGIDYTHADFGGPGTVEAYQEALAHSAEPAAAGLFPTPKVVGGYDFVGDAYDPSSDDPAINTPQPDPNPLDCNGHGTHVAGTAAGQGVTGDGETYTGPYDTDIDLSTFKIGPGVAPEASLYALKVFGCEGGTNEVVDAIEWAMDPNGDGSIADHLDVVNMSLGSDYGSAQSVDAQATDTAIKAGIVVVISSGNAGDLTYISGAPGSASRAITVAASVDNGQFFNAVRVNTPAGLGDLPALEGAVGKPLKTIGGELTGDVVYFGRGCDGDPQLANPAGKIALIDRGTCAFTDKIFNAQTAGAIGFIIANNVPGDPFSNWGVVDPAKPIDIPGMLISQADGQKLKDALATGPVNATLSIKIKFPLPQLADTLADFSSRGPRRGDAFLKPDLSAPGVSIPSAGMGTGNDSRLISGTSMAAPHVAGAAALLVQKHPNWTPTTIKAALVNTAVTAKDLAGDPYPVSLQGAGRIDVAAAAAADTVVFADTNVGNLSFGFVTSSQEPKTLVINARVRNRGNTDVTYTIGNEFILGDGNGAIALEHPATVTARARADTSFKVTLHFDPALLPVPEIGATLFQEVAGLLLLTPTGGGQTLRLPFYIVPRAVAQSSAASNVTIRPGETTGQLRVTSSGAVPGFMDVYTLGALDPRDLSPSAADIGAFGAQAFTVDTDAGVAFGIASYKRWANPNFNPEFDVLIDNNADDVPDFAVFNLDLGRATTGVFDGQVLAAVFNLATGELSASFFAFADFDASTIVLPVLLSDIGVEATGEFSYTVFSFDFLDGDTLLSDDAPIASFNALAPAIAADPATFTLTGTDTISVLVNRESLASTPSAGLLVLEPNDAPGRSQWSIVRVTVR